ncbi:uncharacterized protein [Parasteatoda tepidariorum]|uniref:uncharacterized protein n=1 Tax=Parasteatoda tepidariorum TaxID=114398 RepID=UPI00077F8DDB|nr:uncharacterized protein LOC107446717 [Parasteatoda tepidariorum]
MYTKKIMSYRYLTILIFITIYNGNFSTAERRSTRNLIQHIRKVREINENPMARIQDFLRQARSESGAVDLSALLAENVDDPVSLEPFNISSSGFITDIFGQFTDLSLYGLKGFQLDRIAINFSKMNLSAEMSLPMLSIVGQYYLKGTVTFFPLSGEGPFWMNMSSITLRGHSVMKASSNGQLQVDDIKMDSEVDKIALQFENLMGGGTWGSISNSLLNQLGELILGELKPTLLGELSSYIKYQFDNVIFNNLPEDFLDPKSGNIVDSILERASALMSENGLEPLLLPEYKESFERSMLFVTTRGELDFTNGTLYGLSTLKKKGDVITVFANNSLIFEADFEFENLTGSYLWDAKILGAETSGRMEIQLKSVEGFIKLKQNMESDSRLELDNFYVKGIRHVWLDLQGLGRWDYVMESVINLVTNGLKLQLADAITEPVKNSIQEQLDQLNINSLLDMNNSI